MVAAQKPVGLPVFEPGIKHLQAKTGKLTGFTYCRGILMAQLSPSAGSLLETAARDLQIEYALSTMPVSEDPFTPSTVGQTIACVVCHAVGQTVRAGCTPLVFCGRGKIGRA